MWKSHTCAGLDGFVAHEQMQVTEYVYETGRK
jgi:hypothetical protein